MNRAALDVSRKGRKKGGRSKEERKQREKKKKKSLFSKGKVALGGSRVRQLAALIGCMHEEKEESFK